MSSKFFKKICETSINNIKSYAQFVKFCESPVMKDCCKENQAKLIMKFMQPRTIKIPFVHRRAVVRGGARRQQTKKPLKKIRKPLKKTSRSRNYRKKSQRLIF